MGTVYLGRTPDRENVAVKVVRLDLTGEQEFRERFAREVDAARRVDGSHTAELVYADPHARQPWMATTFVLGPSLREAITEAGPLDIDTLRALGLALAEGLTTIHAAGLVHRDLKPGNVLLTAGGPRIIDFGIARALESTALTSVSQVLGTASYMSPEQVRGFEAGTPSDIFSFGCLLAYAATGNPPFGTGSAESVAYRVVHTAPDLDGLPDQLKVLIHDCLAKDPDHRPTAHDIVERITRRSPRPVTWHTTPALNTMIATRAKAVRSLENRVESEPTERIRPATNSDAPDRRGSGAYKALAAALAGIVLPIGGWMLYDRLTNPPGPDVVADGWYSMMGEPLDPAPDPEHWVEIVISAPEAGGEVLVGYAATVVTSGGGESAGGDGTGGGKETQQIGNTQGFLVSTPWRGKVPVDDSVLAVGVTGTGKGELRCSIAVDQETVVTANHTDQVSCVTPFEGDNALSKNIRSTGAWPTSAPTGMLTGQPEDGQRDTETPGVTSPAAGTGRLAPDVSRGHDQDDGEAGSGNAGPDEGSAPPSAAPGGEEPEAESGQDVPGNSGNAGNGNSGNSGNGNNGCNGKGNPHCSNDDGTGAGDARLVVNADVPRVRLGPGATEQRGRRARKRDRSVRKSVPSGSGH